MSTDPDAHCGEAPADTKRDVISTKTHPERFASVSGRQAGSQFSPKKFQDTKWISPFPLPVFPSGVLQPSAALPPSLSRSLFLSQRRKPTEQKLMPRIFHWLASSRPKSDAANGGAMIARFL
jgi:hypothetical protein